jgi:hypothetical protein
VGGIETDYLVVGAGAAGMAFVDALIVACDADVVMVDRRHHPGGHWNDAYRFVRPHAPSAPCPANPYPDTALDWIPLTCIAQRAEMAWVADRDLSSWLQRSWLNATAGISAHLDDPLMKSALTRLFTSVEPAIAKLEAFGRQRPAA